MNGAPGSSEARRQHRNAWVAALLIGFAFIVLGNLLGWWPWLIAVVVAALMVVFGVSIRGTAVASDAKGDSIYYLGLLFTFVALVAALTSFDWESGATSTLGIIRNFGIALLTTIVGLAGRVWYAMSHDSPGDLEEAIRGDLEEAVSEMKARLDRARYNLDLMADSFEDSAKAMTETFATSAESMAGTTDRIAATADQASQASQALVDGTERVAGAAKSLAEGMEAFQGTVKTGTMAAGRLDQSLGAVAERAASLGRDLASIRAGADQFAATLAEARDATRPVSQAIRDTAEGVTATAAETGALRGTLSGLGRRARHAKVAVERMAETAEAADSQLRSRMHDAQQQAERGKRRIRQVAGRADDLHDLLASAHESAGSAQAGITRVVGRAQTLERRVAASDGTLTASAKSVRRRADDFEVDLADLSDQSGKLSAALTTATEQAESLSSEMRLVRERMSDGSGSNGLIRRMRGLFRRNRGGGAGTEGP